jgi:hypothetical protein
MLIALFYYLAIMAAGKVLSGCKIGDPDFNMWVFLPFVGAMVGLLDGCASFLRLRSFSALIAGPVIHIVLTVVAWYVAKIIPWTQGVDGFPSENGLLVTAGVLGAVVTSGFGGKTA